jgi:hypothetical protein
MNILFELFQTLWPFFFAIGTAPLWAFFWILEGINRVLTIFNPPGYWDSPEFIAYLFYAFLFTNAIIFIEKGVWKLRKADKKLDWLRLWLSQFLIILGATYGVFSQNFFVWEETVSIFYFTFLSFGIVATFIGAINGVVSLGIILAKRFIVLPKVHKQLVKVALKITLFAVYFYPFFTAGVAMYWFTHPDHPQASRFHVINAAVKNTCFIDSERENCPQTLEEISYIEPSKYQELIDCCQVNYQYDQENNLYSLVVRYSPTKAVLFDWRLVDEFGLDFKEYEVEVLGQDRLKDAPEWAGPWEFADWEYL